KVAPAMPPTSSSAPSPRSRLVEDHFARHPTRATPDLHNSVSPQAGFLTGDSQNSSAVMSILFGHPAGNPNSHNAAVAYLEAGVLECFCVPWMPSAKTIEILKSFPPLRSSAQRLERRQFPPLSHVPKVQGRVREIYRLLMRALVLSGYSSDHANRWLMRTMARECRRSTVTAV